MGKVIAALSIEKLHSLLSLSLVPQSPSKPFSDTKVAPNHNARECSQFGREIGVKCSAHARVKHYS